MKYQMRGGKTMDKFQKLYEEILDMFYWAEEQGHISEDATTILIQNLNKHKDIIEKE